MGAGMGASGELRPINLGLGSNLRIGGSTGAPAIPPAVMGRGDCLVGLIPDMPIPCELRGGEELFPFGVAVDENEG